MKTITALLLMLFGLQSQAQEISGRILDERKESFVNVVIQVYQGRTLRGSTITDYDGNYTIKPLDAGYYDMLTIHPGYDSVQITGIIVIPEQRTTQNLSMLRHLQGRKEMVIKAYKKPLINDGDGTADRTWYRKGEGAVVPTTPWSYEPWDNNWFPPFPPEQYQQQRGKSVNMEGAWSTGALHIIDVVPVLTTIVSNLECTTTPITFGILTREQLDQMPWTNVCDLVALFPGVYQIRNGDEVSIFGSRMR